MIRINQLQPLQRKEVDVDKVLQRYIKYMEFVIDKVHLISSMSTKNRRKWRILFFSNDMQSLMLSGITFNASDAYPLFVTLYR